MDLSNIFLGSLNVNSTSGADALIASGAKQNAVNKDPANGRTSFGEQLEKKQRDYGNKERTNEYAAKTERQDNSKNDRINRRQKDTQRVNANDDSKENKTERSTKNDQKDNTKVDGAESTEKQEQTKTETSNDNEVKPEEINVEDINFEAISQEVVNERTSELTQKQNALIDQLAQNLGVSTEKIKQVLQELELKPEDLADTQNMKDFIQKFEDLESPFDLLNLSNLKETMASIKKALDEVDTQFNTSANNENTNVNLRQRLQTLNMEQKDIPAVKEAILNETATNETTTNEAKTAQPVVKEALDSQVKQTSVQQVIAQNTDANVQEASIINSNSTTINHTASSDKFTDSNQQRDSMHDNNAPNAQVKLNNNILNEQTGFTTTTQRSEAQQALTQIPRSQVANMMNQITENVRLNVKFDTTELSMNLKPESLGNITLKLLTTDGKVTAQFLAENSSVKEAIENNLNTLKESLKQQGVNVESISVEVRSQNEHQEQMQQFQKEQEKSGRRIRQILEREGALVEETETQMGAKYVNPYDVSQSSVEYTA